MPKKTKAQKIIAQLRRKLATKRAKREFLEAGKKSTPHLPPRKAGQGRKTKLTTEALKREGVGKDFIQPEFKNQETPSSFVINDLKKSLFLFSLAIVLQLVLYYLLELGWINKLGPLINKIASLVKKG